jgi:hypothetical protein
MEIRGRGIALVVPEGFSPVSSQFHLGGPWLFAPTVVFVPSSGNPGKFRKKLPVVARNFVTGGGA